MRRFTLPSRAAALALLLASCAPAAPAPPAPEVRDVREILERLYAAFSFDAGAQPDWDAQRALFLPGAVFVDPVKEGVPPRGAGAEEFLAKFRAWVETPEMKKGFRERILEARIDLYGHVAHAYVSFEGYVPGAADGDRAKAATRGLDSIQLVLDGRDWKVASFTTQYERPGLPLPRRFRAP